LADLPTKRSRDNDVVCYVSASFCSHEATLAQLISKKQDTPLCNLPFKKWFWFIDAVTASILDGSKLSDLSSYATITSLKNYGRCYQFIVA